MTMTPPYLPNIPRRVAHLLAMLEVRDYPADLHDQFIFHASELDIGDDEEVVVTYERRRKRNAVKLEAVSMTPELEYKTV